MTRGSGAIRSRTIQTSRRNMKTELGESFKMDSRKNDGYGEHVLPRKNNIGIIFDGTNSSDKWSRFIYDDEDSDEESDVDCYDYDIPNLTNSNTFGNTENEVVHETALGRHEFIFDGTNPSDKWSEFIFHDDDDCDGDDENDENTFIDDYDIPNLMNDAYFSDDEGCNTDRTVSKKKKVQFSASSVHFKTRNHTVYDGSNASDRWSGFISYDDSDDETEVEEYDIPDLNEDYFGNGVGEDTDTHESDSREKKNSKKRFSIFDGTNPADKWKDFICTDEDSDSDCFEHDYCTSDGDYPA